MAVNKVVINGQTKIDLSSDTVDSTDKVLNGVTYHDPQGVQQTGTYDPGDTWTAIFVLSTQDPNLYGQTITITELQGD